MDREHTYDRQTTEKIQLVRAAEGCRYADGRFDWMGLLPNLRLNLFLHEIASQFSRLF
jgi:hypothetical protein